MNLFDQPRVRLATLPTPLEFAERLTRELGGPRIYIKRDDLTGLAFGGNKTRKLEFLVADAMTYQATHLITAGGAQSNHARQTAAAACKMGMLPILAMNTSSPSLSPQGNLLLDHLFGAEIHYVATEAARPAKMEEIAADLRDSGAVPYIIPGGGSNGIGALGYVAAMLELSQQLFELGVSPRRLYFATGGGGTHGGIAVGGALFGASYELRGVLVEDTTADGVERAFQVTEWTAERLGIANPVRRDDLVADDRQVGPGYGIATDEGLAAIQLLARTEGILLDPVYTAKAFAGMLADIRAGELTANDSVVFLHTGGAPALFAMTEMITPILG
jgi:D-cysteine desulfhydrase family pyridoxal phosphate-dependent enzyme